MPFNQTNGGEKNQASKKDKKNKTQLHEETSQAIRGRWVTLPDLLPPTTTTDTTRFGCHMRLTRTLSTPMDFLAAPVEKRPAGKHAHTRRHSGEARSLVISQRGEEGPAGLLWHSDHLLSPANTQHGRVTWSQEAHIHTHMHVRTASQQASFPAYFSSALILITLFAPLTGLHLPPVSFIFPPNPPISLPPPSPPLHPSCSRPRRPKTQTTSQPPRPPGDDFSAASALPIQPRRVPIYS